MLDLSEIVKEAIPNYPGCPVERVCTQISNYSPDELNERNVMEFLMEIEKHEDELRAFRKKLEKKLLEYQIETITREAEAKASID